MMVRRDSAGVRLLTRNANDWTDRYPLIAAAAAALKARSFLIDGEAVACDGDGMPSFDRLRYRRADGAVFLFAFDLLELDGRDLRREPLEVRKAHARLGPDQKRSRPAIQRPLRRPAGERRFPPRLQARLRGDRVEAPGLAVCQRADAVLA